MKCELGVCECIYDLYIYIRTLKVWNIKCVFVPL